MQKNYVFLAAAIALTVTSCTKEYVATNATGGTVSDNTNSLTANSQSGKIAISKTSTNYGAWILSPYASTDPNSYNFVTDVASELSVSCLRDITPVPGNKKVKTLTSQYNVLLNFQSNKPKPMKFRTDSKTYQTDLQNTIAAMSGTPTIAVIENEESNKGYYNGSAIDYVNQLKTAISVFHSYGIPVANGGITSVGLEYLVYQDYMNRGMTDQANDYKKRMNVAVNNADTKDRANFISILISNYATMDLDYVNFHFRSTKPEDAQGLGETIDYLKRATGKRVITNEIGQYDQDPATLTATVQMCQNYGLPYTLWYSGQQNDRSYPLQYENKSLTSTGNSYKNYITGH